MVDKIAVNQANEEAEEPYNTADTEQVNKARKKEARNRSVRLRFVEAAMDQPEGRAWFYDILKRCHVFGPLFQNDPYHTAFLCGERNIGQMILSDILDIASNQYIPMMDENKNR